MTALNDHILAGIRLDARHGHEPRSEHEIPRLRQRYGLLPNQVRDAEQEGRRQRLAGMRCYCATCEVVESKVAPHETLRYQYAERRHAELEAAGIQGWHCRQEQIDKEIESGAALQAAPVRVIRTGGTA